MKSLLVIILFALAACNKYCDPSNITSGRSLQHHDGKKFHARVMWTRQYGEYCIVKLENMKQSGKALCKCDCSNFQVGQWVDASSLK